MAVSDRCKMPVQRGMTPSIEQVSHGNSDLFSFFTSLSHHCPSLLANRDQKPITSAEVVGAGRCRAGLASESRIATWCKNGVKSVDMFSPLNAATLVFYRRGAISSPESAHLSVVFDELLSLPSHTPTDLKALLAKDGRRQFQGELLRFLLGNDRTTTNYRWR